MIIRDIYNYIDKIAPFQNADKTDNCGLLVGDMNKKVEKILICLDVTNEVVAEAIQKKVDLIISHHPLMYRGVKQVLKPDPLYALVASGIGFIAAHTNLDVADGGVTDLMLTRLGFPQSDTVIDFFGKVTNLSAPISASELAEKCKTAFECTVVKYVDGKKPISRIGLCSGGGGDLLEKALELNCDAYICGDLRWDRFVFAYNNELTLIDAGHFHTEDIFCEDLTRRIAKEFPTITVEKATNSVDICDYCFGRGASCL